MESRHQADRATDHVQGTRLLGEEIIGSIMSSSSLRDLLVGLRLQSMNHIRELHSILNEENWQIDADDVQVACVGVEASCETSDISSSISTSVFLISICYACVDAWFETYPLSPMTVEKRTNVGVFLPSSARKLAAVMLEKLP